MMKLVLLNDYFRAQIIYTCFWRRLAKKELYHLFSLQTGHKKKEINNVKNYVPI